MRKVLVNPITSWEGFLSPNSLVLEEVSDEVVVCEHDPLGPARGARGVGQDGQVLLHGHGRRTEPGRRLLRQQLAEAREARGSAERKPLLLGQSQTCSKPYREDKTGNV
jgi:hypothetical protein